LGRGTPRGRKPRILFSKKTAEDLPQTIKKLVHTYLFPFIFQYTMGKELPYRGL
jgi:hypothetical protein